MALGSSKKLKSISVFIILILMVSIYYNFSNRQKPQLSHKNSATPQLGDFTLLDHQGNIHTLYQKSDSKFVVIIAHGNDCPIVQKYSNAIRDLKGHYPPNDVAFLMINANLADERALILKEAAAFNYDVPILLDPSQIVTKSLGITRTSEAVVISTADWSVVYRGAIDDRIGFGVDKQVARNKYLEKALDNLLVGRPIPEGTVAAKGCAISYQKKDKILYTRDIVPLIQKKCLSCHAEGGIFPPVLASYEQLTSWALMIRETLFTDRMPPFSADTFYGKFKNDISMSPSEKSMLVQWLDSGLPRDGSTDPLVGLQKKIEKTNKSVRASLPPVVYKVSSPSEVQIPPNGIPEYLYFQLGEALPYDMWVTAIDVTSTNPRQLHHMAIIVSKDPIRVYDEIVAELRRKNPKPEDARNRFRVREAMNEITMKSAKNPSVFSAQVWASGKIQPQVFPEGTMAFFPKGSYLILETHHMGTGRQETEKSTLRLHGYTKKPPQKKRLLLGMSNALDIRIPPNAKKYFAESMLWAVEKDIELLTMRGHLHMRGKAVKLLSVDITGKKTVLVSVPNFYYGWQTGNDLVFEKPIFVPAGRKLFAECEFDNSKQNPNNPDPSQLVEWGQKHDTTEMCNASFSYTLAN